MTLKEWFDKYFAKEYLNVQMPEAHRAQAEADLAKVLKSAPPAPAHK